MVELLQLYLLGDVSIQLDGQPVPGLPSRAAEALLIYLALHERPVSRERLAELLWADRTQKQALTNLRTILTPLRRELGDFLIVTRQSLAFNRQSAYWLDVAEFERQFQELEASPGTHPLAEENAEQLKAVLDLYQGNFLEGFYLRDGRGFEEWAALYRERLRGLARDGFRRLTNLYLDAGRYQDGIRYAERWSEVDPYSEDACRTMMWLFVRSGRPNAALSCYQALQTQLADDLGVTPASVTTELFQRFQSLTFPPLLRLPPTATRFVGRESEIQAITERTTACDPRLLTIVGPGGIGKTRLAIEVARDIVEHKPGRFLDGIFFVSLASLESADLLAFRIAESMGLVFQGSETPQRELLDYLREKEVLLILDNYEQLLDEKGAAITPLVEMLDQGPALKLLITSRERLNLYEELVIDLHGLELPENGHGEPEHFSAVSLFIENARRTNYQFVASPEDLNCIVRTCQLLGGVPLAIELASSLTRRYTCEEIVDQIETSLDFLSTTYRDIPERHRSLRLVFEHSWESLSSVEQEILAQLSIFQGGFTFREARPVIRPATSSGSSAGDFLNTDELIRSLSEKSLLQGKPGERYEIHPVLHPYAAEKLAAESDVQSATAARHAVVFARLLAEQGELYQQGGHNSALARVAEAYENARAAMLWALAETSNEASFEVIDLAWEMLYLFLWARNRFQEGHELFTQIVEALRNEQGHKVLLGKALIGLSEFDIWLGYYTQAEEHLAESRAFLENAEPRKAFGQVLELSGRLAYYTGDFPQAILYLDQSLVVFERESVPGMKAQVLNALGNTICEMEADYDRAMPYFERALIIYREIADLNGIAKVLVNLGATAMERDDYPDAEQFFQKSLDLYQQVDYKYGIWAARNYLATVALFMGEYDTAQTQVEQALYLIRESGNRSALINSLSLLGTILCEQDDLPAAKGYIYQALSLAKELGEPHRANEPLMAAAKLLAEEGHPTQGIKILGFVLEGNRDNREVFDRANQLYEELSQDIAPEAVAEAFEWGQAKSLEEVVASDIFISW